MDKGIKWGDIELDPTAEDARISRAELIREGHASMAVLRHYGERPSCRPAHAAAHRRSSRVCGRSASV
jgi:hypothetical protein